MKVLLVAPKLTAKPGDFYQFPLGLGYISSSLKAAGHQVVCINCNNTAEDPDAFVARAILEHQPDACASGGLSPFLPKVRAIFDVARRTKPDILNIVGGGVLSSDPEAAPHLMDIDAGVIGEGEATVVDLCAALDEGRDLRTVPGIVFLDRGATQCQGLPTTSLTRRIDRGKVIRTASRDPIHDLGALPWPDYEGFGFDEIIGLQRTQDHYLSHAHDRPRMIDMISSRSCPYRCTFCFHPTGKVYRERPLDDYFAELDHLTKRYQVTSLALIDELFSLKRERLLEFCERIKPYGIDWVVQLHVNCAEPDVLDAMRDAGCTYISYGVESMSQKVLDSMQKGSRRDRIDLVMRNTYERRIGIQGNLIFGDTSETLETANESMDWWAHHREYMINAYRLQVFPGSPDYIEAVRDGLITDREKFIDELKIDINISQMNDSNLRMLTLLSGTTQSTLLRLAPIRTFEPELDPEKGETFHIVWDCPRCQNVNDYHNVIPNLPADRRWMLQTCRRCHARSHIENRSRLQLHERPTFAQDEAAFQAAMATLAAGDVDGAVAALKALVECSVAYHPAHTALARHYLARCEAAEVPSTADEMATVFHFAIAVLENPYEADLHLDYAKSLIRKGAHGLGRLHLEQTLLLAPGHPEALERLKDLDDPRHDPALRRIYVPSFSDAPAPKRMSKEGYVKAKREKEFPDVAAIEDETRERLKTAI